jgi:hypothetical protein
MIEVISLFKTQDTRDELGVGSVRDAFADLFFPGTSTIQTRAKYFLFIPWHYRELEEKGVPSRKIRERLRREELKLVKALKETGSEGIIGGLSGASLQRFPSSIYWNGMRTWGILRYPGSQGQYQRSLDAFYDQRSNRMRTEVGEPVEGWGGIRWDPDLPEIPEDFPGEATFDLAFNEAQYLQERLLIACHESLLATIVEHCDPVHDVKFISEHPQLARFPEGQQRWIEHGHNFSQIVYGAVLLYNLMLAELVEDTGLQDEYRQQLEDWEGETLDMWSQLTSWDTGEFWSLVGKHARIPPRTRRFVEGWLSAMLNAPSGLDVANGQPARNLVRARERELKRRRSRFESHEHLAMWSGGSGLGKLDYRWPISNRITNDILNGLED